MRAAGEPVAAKRVVDQLVGDDAGVVCAVSDADKRRFAEGPRVADAEPHRLRPVRIEVIGAVATPDGLPNEALREIKRSVLVLSGIKDQSNAGDRHRT
jgi:hypothetical protein